MNWQEAKDWTLIAAGPSRVHIRPEHLQDGPVVSVNRAIDVTEQGVRVDFAAISDGPEAAWKQCNLARFWRPEMLLWVSSRTLMRRVKPEGLDKWVEVPGPPIAKLWNEALPASIGFRLMPSGILLDEDSKKERLAFTTFCAFRGILRYQPRSIRILSMDMKGSWIEGWTEEACHAHEMERHQLDRWRHESRSMEKEINRARGEGVRVEVVIPEPLAAVA